MNNRDIVKKAYIRHLCLIQFGEQASVDNFSEKCEPAVLVPVIAKQQDVFVRAIASGALASF